MYSKIIIMLFSVILLFSGGAHLKAQNKADLQKNTFPIKGKWMYYDYEKKLLLVLKIGAVQSISIEEQDFVNVNSKYSGTYTYSDQKLKYHLTNRETKASRSGTFTISFTDEGQMKVKFNENFKFKIATNKSFIFRQEKTPIPFRKNKPTAESFYKALYPYIFEPEVSYTYPCVISGKCAKGTKVNYSPDQRQLEYVSFDESNNIEYGIIQSLTTSLSALLFFMTAIIIFPVLRTFTSIAMMHKRSSYSH